MASLELLVDDQQAGLTIYQPSHCEHRMELWELMAVVSIAKPDEATLNVLLEEHMATIKNRKRKREPKVEHSARANKMIRRR
jgi:deoxyadenosine/deoxycytidine kinase